MYWIDTKYVSLLSGRLSLFKKKNNSVYNFRCPICHDSQKNQHKARAYIYEKKGIAIFFCHNCNQVYNLGQFIRLIDPTLYTEYKLDLLKDNRKENPTETTIFEDKMKPIFNPTLKGLKKISQLNPNDPLKKYIVNRKIPPATHHLLYACPNFMHFVNKIIPEKFSKEALKFDETRLLIPFFNMSNQLIAFQGRSIKEESLNRYIFITLQEDVPILFGLERVDLRKRFYVFEGPIDSLFITNALASGGGDIVSSLSRLEFAKNNAIIVYDREYRNKETVKKNQKAIDNGYNISLWPENIECKDVNDMVLNGYDIQNILEANVYNGLKARAKLQQWKKT